MTTNLDRHIVKYTMGTRIGKISVRSSNDINGCDVIFTAPYSNSVAFPGLLESVDCDCEWYKADKEACRLQDLSIESELTRLQSQGHQIG